MADLAQHFHLPINAAAKELGICPTVLKKICRRNGMRRWPHRKVGILLTESSQISHHALLVLSSSPPESTPGNLGDGG